LPSWQIQIIGDGVQWSTIQKHKEPSLYPSGFSAFQTDAFSSLNHNTYRTSVQFLQLYTMQS